MVIDYVTGFSDGTYAVTVFEVGTYAVMVYSVGMDAHFFSKIFTPYSIVFYLSTEEYFHTL